MGAKLQKEKKIDLILQSLPKHFNQVKVNYNMHKMDLTPVQLMHELKSVKQSLIEPGSINFTKGSVKPKGKPKGGWKQEQEKEGSDTSYQIRRNEEAERQVLQMQTERTLET